MKKHIVFRNGTFHLQERKFKNGSFPSKNLLYLPVKQTVFAEKDSQIMFSTLPLMEWKKFMDLIFLRNQVKYINIPLPPQIYAQCIGFQQFLQWLQCFEIEIEFDKDMTFINPHKNYLYLNFGSAHPHPPPTFPFPHPFQLQEIKIYNPDFFFCTKWDYSDFFGFLESKMHLIRNIRRLFIKIVAISSFIKANTFEEGTCYWAWTLGEFYRASKQPVDYSKYPENLHKWISGTGVGTGVKDEIICI